MDEENELLPSPVGSDCGAAAGGGGGGGEWWVSMVSGDLGCDLLGLMLTGGERLIE